MASTEARTQTGITREQADHLLDLVDASRSTCRRVSNAGPDYRGSLDADVAAYRAVLDAVDALVTR